MPDTQKPIKDKPKNAGPDTWCKVEMRALLVSKINIRQKTSGPVAEITVQTQAPWYPLLAPEQINVMVYGRAIEYLKRAKVGDVLRIEGYIQTFQYEDQVTRMPRVVKKVIAEFLHVCSNQGKYANDIETVIAKNTY
jgi:single-stranded DNA-binding protein